MEFANSKTMENLMRAFAGESQARNRYTFAAGVARSQKLIVVARAFEFTADQEKEHAELFYKYLAPVNRQTVQIDGTYPVNLSDSVAELLRFAQHNEYEEHDDVYKKFAEKAEEEGFNKVASSFRMIAEIEKIHGDRFGIFAKLMEEGKLFVSDVETEWMCLNCGYVYKGTKAPSVCPVCSHDQGYFVRFELVPFEDGFGRCK